MIISDQYVLDADVFMTAARRYYAFDIAPGFWEALVAQASNGRVLSIDRVKGDIDRGNDDLKVWANSVFLSSFASTAQNDVIEAYRRIISWVQSQSQFTDAARAEFAGGSDGWLLAYAVAKGCVVVTNEKPEPNIKRRVKIPGVCQGFKVRYVDTFEMIRALGIRLG